MDKILKKQFQELSVWLIDKDYSFMYNNLEWGLRIEDDVLIDVDLIYIMDFIKTLKTDIYEFYIEIDKTSGLTINAKERLFTDSLNKYK